MPFPSLPSPPSLFPTYLVPSNPFRRRKSSTDSTASANSTSSNPTSQDSYLNSSPTSHLHCARCLSDLAPTTQIISKGFTGRHGRAYLARNDALPNLPNTYVHRPVPRQLVTGAHTVGDISCALCGSVLGWKYVSAEEESQRYKVGKFILETGRVCRRDGWDGVGEEGLGGEVAVRRDVLEETVEFDSQDEDECEDLFLGVWTPQLAKRRRRERERGFRE
ncbi:uncharacterized protein MYCGRDRAFT_73372 [Zymoseptoria tritici IPO323]|uniref:Yippee domain-containing protein n=1 Tax=Zymoseptoria tritici (strain CBS 115943 / IPO323) TaxID=336722 RepID=F9XDU6_ZYMTI|nr:uncharacterized protein MYCGRDRAFT_73372 [Zymoseptoria tritici IPO323]EGP86554.1 hypothetical protein MYCGRDRAFT_73372 [Zymoseptoria tritici IPO323]